MADQTYRFSIEPQVRLDQASGQIAKLQQQLDKLSMPKTLGAELKKELGNLSDLMGKYKDQLKQGISNKADSKALDQTRKQVEQTYQGIINKIDELNGHDIILKADASALKDLEKEITGLKERIQTEFAEALKGDNTKLSGLSAATRSTQLKGMVGQAQTAIEKGDLKAYEKALDNIKIKINDLADNSQKKLAKALTGTEFASGKNALDEIGKELEEMKKSANDAYNAVKPLQDEISGKEVTYGEELANAFERGEQASQGLNSSLNKTKQSVDLVGDSVVNAQNDFEKLEKTTRTLESQVESYFGLNAIFRTVANLAREAMETVKTLDKAMTETAVVTNYSVSDMWEKLPIYTAEANKLGSTIEDVYRATTLYYQQGLNTSQSMGLAVETLKMARIAGMDAKDATNAMTAALRGFNLELNQTSAQRINDVYSELAAITASDTQEISTAMEKVASLAHNAGMEVETTSAFLAQMIETTREAPENLGTALKTVIARFQEMKQDPTKLIDSEGVAMDANKVDKALKSIGVALTNERGEFRKLDDVFLEIAGKWDTLTMGQQRYIATMAAGSRQQSRFIAMMSNYSRTMELVDAAYNSSGASQRQFEKTLESMDSKLNQLKNAWDQFTMGLMNNELLKGAVDLGTDLLDIINKIINAVSELAGPGKGIAKSIITLTATVAGLNGASKLLHGVIQGGTQWAKGTNNKGLITNIFGEVFKKREKMKMSTPDMDVVDDANLKQQAIEDAQTYKTTFLNTIKGSIGQAKQALSGRQSLASSQIENPIDAAYYKKLQKDAQQFEANGQIDLANDARKQAETMLPSLSKTQKAAFKTADGFNAAGTALQAFGNALANSNSRLAPFGKALSAVGSGMVQLSGVMMTSLNVAVKEGATGLAAFGTAAKFTLTTILPYVAIFAAIAAAGYLLYREFTREKREMEALANAAKTSSDAFDNLKTASEELKNSIEEIRNADSLFDGLVVGTTEWNLALVEANQQILDLIKKYPMLQDYLTTDVNGRMGISEAGFKAVQDEQKKILGQAQSLEILTNSAYNTKLKEQDYDKLLKENGVHKPIARAKGEDVITEQEAFNMGYSGLSDEAKQEWDGIQAQIEAEAANARKQAVRAALASNGELNDTILNLFSQNLDTAAQSFEGETDMSVIKQAYADFIGGVFDSATGTITDLSGEEVSVDNDALKKMYPQIMALLKFQDEAPQVESAVKSLGKSFDSVFGKNEGNNFINDLLNNNVEIDLSALDKFRKMTDQELTNALEDVSEEEVKAIMQSDTAKKSDLIALLKGNADNLIQTQTKAYADATVWYAKTVKKWNSVTAKVGAAPLANTVAKGLTVNGAEIVNKFMTEVSKGFDNLTTTDLGNNFINGLMGQPEEVQAKVREIFSGVDWSSAIERGQFYQLYEEGSEAFKALDEDTQTFIKNFIEGQKDLDESLNLTGKQFEELVQSSDFLDILTEKWSDFTNESGQIDASGVEAMAKECGTLNELLEQGTFDANGLAMALNYFQETGSFEGITSAVIAASKEFQSLDKYIGQVKKDIEEFQPGENYEQGMDAYRGYFNSLKEGYENRQYSDADTLSYAYRFIDEGKWKTYAKQHGGSNKSYERSIIKRLESIFGENEKDTTSNILNRMANGETLLGNKAGKTDAFTVGYDKQGNLKLNIDEKTTRDDFVKALTENYDFTEEFARAFMLSLEGQDWGFIDDNLTDAFNKAGREGGIAEYKAGLEERGLISQDGTTPNNLVISNTELEALKAMGGYESIDEVRQDLADQLGIAADNIREFNSETEGAAEYLQKYYGNKDDRSTFRQSREFLGGVETVENKRTVNGEDAYAKLQQSGLEASQALDMMIDMAHEAGAEQVQWGEDLIDISDIINGEQFNEAVAEMKDGAHWTDVGQTIASAITAWFDGHFSSSGSSDGVTEGPKNTTTTNTVTTNVSGNNEGFKKTVDDSAAYASSSKAVIPITGNSEQAIAEADNAKAKIENKKAELSIRGKDNTGKDIANIRNKISVSEAKIPVKVEPSGSMTITFKAAARGQNNRISSTGFYAGSSARGRYGTVGPKDKGGLTLTGEKGFEIAWIPSENRSMILGANGPQMTNLPADAVIYTHEQSKKIVKQKTIPAGSMYGGTYDNSTSTSTSGNKSKKSSKKKSSKKKSKSKSSSKSSSKGEINNFSIEEVIRFNVDQKIATQTAAIEKRTKSIEKSLDKIGTTYGSIASDINKQVAGVKDLKAQNQALVQSYERQLAALDKNYKQKVSWTDSKGNSKEKTVNLGDYIKKVGDSYQIDQAKIAKLGSPAEREAVFNAANSALSNLTSGLLNAKKAVDEAEQQLEDFRKQLQDTFYGWENELTKIYNLSQQIESLDLSSDRFSAEIDSTLALVGTQFLSVANTGKRLIEVQKQNASVLTQNIQKQAELIKARRDQLALDIDYTDELKAYNNILSTNRAKASKGALTEQDKIKQNAAYDALVAAQMPTRYANRTRMQDGSYQLDIDWAKLERDRTAGNITEKTYDAIKNGIDKMQESINEYNQSIIDGFNSLQEIAEQYNNYVETLADLEKEVADAIKDMALNQVARLESLNKSIVDAGKKILDQARKNLQNRRQSEDNAKTETDIAKKENRLAALRANTSGGNQVEIAQLQKEINDARQNYGRTLEDQLLSRLQTQSDEAAAQRQEQIDLLKQQIELNSLNGVYFQEADALLTNVDAHSSEIKDILTTTQEETTGKWGAQVWEQELEQKIGNAITAEAGIPQLASVIQSEGSALREALVSANASSTSVSGTQSASTASIAKNPVIENKAPASTPKASSTPAKSASSSSSKYPYGKASDTTGNIKKGAKGTQVKAIQYALKQLHYVNKKGKSLTVDGNFDADTQYAVKNFQKKRKIKATGIVNDTTRSKFRAMGYKTGGIADYTGPAWLDGTPSKPEMVLNAQDTKNFIALKDILAGVMHDISHMDSSETYNAPMEFNINVNVDKISNDYDVDKLANRLKKDIVKDMSYRNVTQVRKFR